MEAGDFLDLVKQNEHASTLVYTIITKKTRLRQNVQEKEKNSAECHAKQKKKQGVSGSDKNKKNLCIVRVWHKKEDFSILKSLEKPGMAPGQEEVRRKRNGKFNIISY